MNTNLLAIVKQIIAEHGEDILANPQRLKAFFADLARDEPKPQKNALIKCVELKYAQMLKDVAQTDRDGCKKALAKRLYEEEGLDAVLCEETLELLAAVLFGEQEGQKTPVGKPVLREHFDLLASNTDSVVEPPQLVDTNTMPKKAMSVKKSIVVIVIGAALVFAETAFASGLPILNFSGFIFGVQISLGFVIIAVFAAVFGPLVGLLIGLIGQFLVSWYFGFWGLWWIFVITTPLLGLAVGGFHKLYLIDEGKFGIKQMAIFNVVQVVAVIVIFIARRLVDLWPPMFTLRIIVSSSLSVLVFGTLLIVGYVKIRKRIDSQKVGQNT